MKHQSSPFKFLNSYTAQDQEIFFGREKEELALHEMLKTNRLALVFGQSGTGKTSLVQCGLARHFDVTEWFPLFINRKDDLNASLLNALRDAIENQAADNPIDIIQGIYFYYLRPIYLIFDQFEELLIMGQGDEQQRFIHTIASILEAKLPCRILFVLREEYIARLYEFEKAIPNLFDRSLRLAPMNRKSSEQVILKSCTKFNISLEDPPQNARQIIDNLSGEKAGIQLPYLQVYLDMLWRKAYWRTFPQGTNEPLPHLTFTAGQIAELGQIDDVLAEFLDEQIQEIYDELAGQFPQIERGLVRRLLDDFVTTEGTKRPISYRMEDGIVHITQGNARNLQNTAAPLRTHCLRRLEQSRLIVAREGGLELAHDSLATLIEQGRSEEQRRLNQSYNIIKHGYQVYLQTLKEQQVGRYLSREELLLVAHHLEALNLEPHLRQFAAASMADNERKEQAEKETLRRRARHSYMAAVLGVLLAIGAFSQYLRAHANKEKAIAAKTTEELAKQHADSLLLISDKQLAELKEAKANEVRLEVIKIIDGLKKLGEAYPLVRAGLLDSAEIKLCAEAIADLQSLDSLRSLVKQKKEGIK